MLEKVITVKEAADILGITVQNVRVQCKQGKLQCRFANGTWLILKESVTNERN